MSDASAAPAAAPANGAPRNNSGQFSPKAGATGVVPQEGAAPTKGQQGDAPPSGPQSVAEWEGYEGEVDVYGEKRKVQVKSKAEALRAHQELLAYRQRHRGLAEREKRWASFDSLPPEQKAELLGFNMTEVARKKVIEAARQFDEEEALAQLAPEHQERLRRAKANEEKLARIEAEQATEQQRRQQEAEQQQRLAARREAVAGLEKGLELSGLPKTHHTMALLAEIQQECTDQRLPPLPPDLLAAEANKRYNERGVEPLKKLQGKSLLERLGPDVVRAVLLAERERRGLAAGQPPRQPSTQPLHEMPKGDKVYGEAEAEQRLRDLRNAR